jgi:hypothetical protein
MGKRKLPKWDETSLSLEQRLQFLLDLSLSSPGTTVTRFETWDIDSLPVGDSNGIYALGVGERQMVPFDDQLLASALQWLASDAAAWLEELPYLLARKRALAQQPERVLAWPVTGSSLVELLTVAGDFGLSRTVAGVPAVALSTLVAQLSALRISLMLALAFQKQEKPAEFFAQIERGMEALSPGITAELYEHFGSPASGHFPLARMFFLAGSELELLGVGHLFAGDTLGGGPLRVDPGPRTPQQAIWFTIALSAGAIVSPYPVPGVFRCSYHLCQKVFVSRKLGVGGQLRFCSVAHGKRYHAARRMKEKTRAKTQHPANEEK